MDSSNWAEQTGLSDKISVEELDQLIITYKEKRDLADDAKKVKTKAEAEKSVAEGNVITALTACGKKSFKVDGVGTFTRVMKEVITTPKSIEDKLQVYAWIVDKYGADVLEDMRGINHATLNSFYNQEVEKEKDNPAFSIPGLAQPTSRENASFTKAKL